jgi:hypothetical protein
MLVEGIAIVADTYEEATRILLSPYGDKNRIIQAQIDYLQNVQLIRYQTPDVLNSAFIECHRRVPALRALREDVNGYSRVIAPQYTTHPPQRHMSLLDCPREAGGPL